MINLNVVFCFLASMFLSIIAYTEVSHRFLISAGVLSNADSFEAFYNSRIFSGDVKQPFSIEDAQVSIFVYKNTGFFSKEEITLHDIVSANNKSAKISSSGFKGQSFLGLSFAPVLHSPNNTLLRYLGAMPLEQTVYSKEYQGKTIYAFSLNNLEPVISWPNLPEQIHQVPGVLIQDNKQNYLVVAREVGALANKLGLIDKLKLKDQASTSYIDIGTSHGFAESIVDEQAVKLLSKRKPLQLLAGTFEMTSMLINKSRLNILPCVFPIKGYEQKQSLIGLSSSKANFWALAGEENFWPLYAALGEKAQIKDVLKQMEKNSQEPSKSLNIVRVFSEDAALEAAKSVYVDLVLLLSKNPFSQLANRELIELKNPATDSYDQVAPIVRVSYLDITELTIFGPELGNISKVEINRHSISDESPRASDVEWQKVSNKKSVLPAMSFIYSDKKYWNQKYFDSVLAGIMMEKTQAEIAIFESDNQSTPIKGELNSDIARRRLARDGNLAVISATGQQIKKIAKNIGDKNQNINLVIFGIDKTAKHVHTRSLANNERFNVALSEKALLHLFGISSLGGLADEYSNRAPFVEGVYGKIENLFFMSGPNTMATADTASLLGQQVSGLKLKSSIASMVDEYLLSSKPEKLQEFINFPEGKPKHSLNFNISYLDIGLSQNLGNKQYEDYQDKSAIPLGRAGVPVYTHILLYSKADITHDAPNFITSLGGAIKYLHTVLDAKPERDKVTLSLDFRMPWERNLFKDKDIIVSPILKNSLDTQLRQPFKNKCVEAKCRDGEEAQKTMQPRDKIGRSLLGGNLNFTRLGFSLDVGGVLAADFNRSSASDAIDYGPGLNLFGHWPLIGPLEFSTIITSYYLFPASHNLLINRLALGVEGQAWLRIARFYDFSISLMSDFLIASLQNAPKDMAMSSVFGLTLSFQRLFKILG